MDTFFHLVEPNRLTAVRFPPSLWHFTIIGFGYVYGPLIRVERKNVNFIFLLHFVLISCLTKASPRKNSAVFACSLCVSNSPRQGWTWCFKQHISAFMYWVPGNFFQINTAWFNLGGQTYQQTNSINRWGNNPAPHWSVGKKGTRWILCNEVLINVGGLRTQPMFMMDNLFSPCKVNTTLQKRTTIIWHFLV